MKGTDHKRFGKYVAKQTYLQEMKRRKLERTPLSDFVADQYIKKFCNNISVLPDRQEPAVNQYHRGVFHSEDIFRKIEEVKEQIRNKTSKDWQIDIGLPMALSAYQSHIALDSTTPMGVPDYGWLWKLLKSFERGAK